MTEPSAAHDPAPMVPLAVRLGMVVVLAVPQLVTGVWAIVAPRSFFTSFPGFDPRLVAALPPYNAHLATDAGAGFFAVGVALALAAWWGERRAVLSALATAAAFLVPHAVFHLTHDSPGLHGGEDLYNAVLVLVQPAFLAGLAWAVRRPITRPGL